MVNRGRVVILGAFAGLGILLLSLVLFANSGQDTLKQINIDLVGVKLIDVDKINNRAHLEVLFNVTNPTTITSTIPSITYDLFVNGKDLGSGHYSTEDIASCEWERRWHWSEDVGDRRAVCWLFL